ncbi:hypothetical protein GMORB2_5119 [Geosmithia morbida]|uniref:Uncharacterized protein n=1 Tax=Geosmithia morbida TaxID=1094350 RepID=A0A9P4YZD7_9HYPO|nr:uncharacterized protein GMORB2_5119 [Geosmithia morbida]KAF4124453.1 hypothetical protein GMORB2_5119 [Geosmithia morbida]
MAHLAASLAMLAAHPSLNGGAGVSATCETCCVKEEVAAGFTIGESSFNIKTDRAQGNGGTPELLHVEVVSDETVLRAVLPLPLSTDFAADADFLGIDVYWTCPAGLLTWVYANLGDFTTTIYPGDEDGDDCALTTHGDLQSEQAFMSVSGDPTSPTETSSSRGHVIPCEPACISRASQTASTTPTASLGAGAPRDGVEMTGTSTESDMVYIAYQLSTLSCHLSVDPTWAETVTEAAVSRAVTSGNDAVAVTMSFGRPETETPGGGGH